jgi:hypothetical protein
MPTNDLEIVSVRLGRAEALNKIPIYRKGDVEIYYEDWFYDDGSYHPTLWAINYKRNVHLSIEGE